MKKNVPDFFLVGAVKSGSTSAYYYLDEHPHIFMSPIKEPHYFSSCDMDFAQFRPLIKKRVNSFNLRAYLDSSMKYKVHRAYIKTEADYLKLFKNAVPDEITGEASTSYLWSPSAAKKISLQNPAAKLIIMLRNPIERAFSHYLMDVKINLTEAGFSEALQSDQNVQNPSWGKNSMYIETGMYTNQVKRFMDVFPASQVLIVLYDEFKSEALNTIQKMYRFLEADDSFVPDLSAKHNTSFIPFHPVAGKFLNTIFIRKYFINKIGSGYKAPFKRLFSKHGKQPALLSEEKRQLLELYKKDIVNLQQLIHRDLSHWLI